MSCNDQKRQSGTNDKKRAKNTMVSREVLLAELEEEQERKRKKFVEVLSIEVVDSAEGAGYNPYDNPGTSKTVRDADAITARRCELQDKKRRR
jgi:hypothetical protein